MLLTRRLLLGSVFVSLIAPPARSATADEGFRVLTARKAMSRILPEPAAETAVAGFDGLVPGPLLRCKQGEDLKIRLVNQLDEPITLSCWGMRIENAMDGAAGLTQKPVLPGQSFDYRIKPPDSGFYWYRSLIAPTAIAQLCSGLYGPIIVDEPAPPAVAREIIAVIADWQLDSGAQITHEAAAAGHITVNSQTPPSEEVLEPGARVRLRFLNATLRQIRFIAFEQVKPIIIAIDGQPCEAFEPLQHMVPIAPGGRFDIMFDLPTDTAHPARVVLRGDGGPDQALMTFKTKGDSRASLPPIASLPQNPLLPAEIKLQVSLRKNIVIEGAPAGGASGENATDPKQGLSFDGRAPRTDFAAAPSFSVRRGTPVTLSFTNKTTLNHEVHVHGHSMRLLHDLDDGWEPYWRDSVIVPNAHTKHVAFVADNPGKWAIECLPLDPQLDAMATWFEVT